MKKLLFLSRFFVFLLLLVASNSAHAYFIRPYVQVAGSTIDGIIQDGVTQGSQSFTTSFQSEVDLAAGTISGFLSTQTTGGGFGQVGGSFGDTLTFTNANADRETVTLDFAYDGLISTGTPTDASFFVIPNANLYVRDPGEATYDTFNDFEDILPDPIAFDNFFDQSLNNTGNLVNQPYSNQLSVSLMLEAGQSVTYDIFTSLFILGSSTDVPIIMDFMNTGQFGINANTGVTFTSASGVFLTAQNPAPVPEPATMLLLGTGIIGLAGFRRKFKRSN